jgi:glycosyltransferase involved in cell wall biosynthesis
MCSNDKVLIITPFFKPNIGGAETFAEDLAKALAKKCVVHICTIKWQKPIVWEGMNFAKSLYLLSRLAEPLWKMTRKYKYHRVYALGLMPSFLCCLFGIKFSSVILALYDFKRPNWFTHILNRAEKVYVEGLRGKEDMLSLGVKPDKLVVFQHWCDQSRFYYKDRTNTNLKVLFVGRPIWIKGKHVIELCERLTKGIEYAYIENVPYESLASHYQMADVCVVPSLYSEGFSRVVIESASCGCAVIASNRGALPELIASFGKCIEPTADKFAEVLMKLKNRTIVEKIQVDTALYAKQNFSEDNASCFLLP